MTHRDPNRYADRIVFWVCAALLFVFYTQAVYDYGHTHGQAKCRPVVGVPKKSQHSLYDLPPRQLRRVIRYEKMKGQP